MLGMRLCVLHNLYFYNTMMEEIRDALDKGCYEEYKARKLESMALGAGNKKTVFLPYKKTIKFGKNRRKYLKKQEKLCIITIMSISLTDKV